MLRILPLAALLPENAQLKTEIQDCFMDVPLLFPDTKVDSAGGLTYIGATAAVLQQRFSNPATFACWNGQTQNPHGSAGSKSPESVLYFAGDSTVASWKLTV